MSKAVGIERLIHKDVPDVYAAVILQILHISLIRCSLLVDRMLCDMQIISRFEISIKKLCF